MTFFEAVEALKVAKIDVQQADDDNDKKKKNNKDKIVEFKFEPHQLITSIDLSGFKFMRFSRAGL
jgi:hypothetical protein